MLHSYHTYSYNSKYHKYETYVQLLILLYVYLSVNTHTNFCTANDILIQLII